MGRNPNTPPPLPPANLIDRATLALLRLGCWLQLNALTGIGHALTGIGRAIDRALIRIWLLAFISTALGTAGCLARAAYEWLQPWPSIDGLYYPRGFVLEEVYNARWNKVSGILGEALTVLLWGGIALGVTWYVRWGRTGRAGLGEGRPGGITMLNAKEFLIGAMIFIVLILPMLISIMLGLAILGGQAIQWLRLATWQSVSLRDGLASWIGKTGDALSTGLLGLDRLLAWCLDGSPITLWLIVILPVAWFYVWAGIVVGEISLNTFSKRCDVKRGAAP